VPGQKGQDRAVGRQAGDAFTCLRQYEWAGNNALRSSQIMLGDAGYFPEDPRELRRLMVHLMKIISKNWSPRFCVYIKYDL
jgi:hypothetical protein